MLEVILEEQTDSDLSTILCADSVQDAIERVALRFGIDYVTFHMVASLRSSLDNPFVRTTYPAEWVTQYLLNNYVACDPTLRTAMTSDRAFCWSEITPTPQEHAVLLAAQRFGLGENGFSAPCSDPFGRKGVLSLNSRMPPSDWQALLHEHGATLVDLARDLHIKAVAEAFAERGDSPHLSPRENECLRWTSEGKTYSEIAMILGLSDHTVRSYLKVARLKLDCVSLAQAVCRANRLGLI